MIRVQKPEQFSRRDPAHNYEARVEHETHPSVQSFMAHIQGPGTGGPGKAQTWTWVVEDNASGTWRRIGRVEKHHDHTTTFIPDPVPAPTVPAA